MSDKKIVKTPTSLKSLKGYMGGALLELPPFGPGQEFYAMICRPSLMELIKQNKIPNDLIGVAMDLFMPSKDSKKQDPEEIMHDMRDVMVAIARASFVKPTYDEMVEGGIELTDEQLIFVFNYSQQGVNALKSFR